MGEAPADAVLVRLQGASARYLEGAPLALELVSLVARAGEVAASSAMAARREPAVV